MYFKVRLGGDERVACLVIVGALPNGRKEVIALEDGYRESTQSWKTVLRDLKTRGMKAPQLAVADGETKMLADMPAKLEKTQLLEDVVL